MYSADVSTSLISKVTDAVMDQIIEWRSTPLDAVYPIVYLDCIVLKIRQDRKVINKSVYLALGVNLEGDTTPYSITLTISEGPFTPPMR